MRSLISLDRHIIHRETFQGGDQGVRLNPYHRSVPTAMAYGNAGGRIGSYGIFNGTTSKIDCGSDFIGTQAISISAWIYADGWGETTHGRILDNGKFQFYVSTIANSLRFTSNGSTRINSATDSITANVWYHVAITRNSAGDEINFYINGVLSGTANQDSGTPEAGTTNVIIGNNDAQSITFDGFINLEVYDLVLTADEAWALYNGRLYR